MTTEIYTTMWIQLCMYVSLYKHKVCDAFKLLIQELSENHMDIYIIMIVITSWKTTQLTILILLFIIIFYFVLHIQLWQ